MPALPIIISSGPASLPVAIAAADYYAAHLDQGTRLILMRPRRCRGDHAAPAGLTIVDDEDVPDYAGVRAGLDAMGDRLGRFGRSPIWYLQQYLKLAGARHLAPDGAIVTDGDTIFSAALLRALRIEPKILTTNETFENYNHLARALGIVPLQRSCVANGNVFYPAMMPAAIMDGDGFLDIIERLVLGSEGARDFSEYQLMGSLVAPGTGTLPVRMFRRFDLLDASGTVPSASVIERALRRYDAIAIEHGHRRSASRTWAAHLLYAIRYSW
ncbi:hypothetical protein [Sphingomonas ginsenosidimutans]|uniref:hypothetical protein n=1 Tax=Sphingomonas ginsenosidimutans TaxID=862134 RepID=UPI001D3E1D70|nr:hypothetical protein [Sphingomonas ginsenosidimutans]MBY0300237.1 hypothetical protein [Sphingomonas ginsenosidimutans]